MNKSRTDAIFLSSFILHPSSFKMLTPGTIRHHLDRLTKPPGSLGRLEDLAVRLCGIQQTLAPKTQPRRLVLFAADHGVVAEGVTAWPAAVTHLMVQNIVAGGAASSVLARTTGTDLLVIDVGTLGPDLGSVQGYACHKVLAGSRNLAIEPALTIEEFARAMQVRAAAGAGGSGLRRHESGCRWGDGNRQQHSSELPDRLARLPGPRGRQSSAEGARRRTIRP